MKVSVIIPVYNVEAYVGDALQSILDQTLRDFEIICVNDGSTDGSWNVVSRFSHSDARICLYENPSNMGPPLRETQG